MIEVNNLVYHYPGSDDPTIKDVSFSIGEGEIFGFLGPSGAGKSTTQKILIRLLRKYQGSIKVLGKDLDQWKEDFYNHVGVGFELPNHYSKLTALENLQLFSSFYDKPTRDPMELMEMVGLAEDAQKPVSSFSKGMKMRLNFIRSFLHNPEILFFDEPTSGLDPVNARRMKKIILDQKADGKTIFVTTHAMLDADELCDRVAFILEGKIALIDSPKKLKLEYGKRMVLVEYEGGRQEFALDGLGNNAEFLSIIKKENLQTIHTEEATLEDIFVKVTGHSLKSA